ncbi:hypothetical protein XELAEV_18007339mg [Xenopus laevis]|uniref:Uncharacterized protein n=1 Tax=Xenopus laevis TaxID=8355 RepID=A0A974E2R4_XENLA|nr:hypothetical protein XELAEV_18007339mg [Xenopus laevis]
MNIMGYKYLALSSHGNCEDVSLDDCVLDTATKLSCSAPYLKPIPLPGCIRDEFPQKPLTST